MPDAAQCSPLNSQQGVVSCPAVLLVVFNRPDTTKQVMDALRIARPVRLYVAADGPRDRPGERERCEETRQVATDVDWPCEVKTLFRDTNLGCRRGVSGAIDWFFEAEEQGIILEDDCVPSSSFFSYCSNLLEKHKNDPRIMCVSGSNLLPGGAQTPESYYLSRYMMCWGWASWRRAWALYDRDMALWPQFRDSGGLRAWSDGRREYEEYWRNIFEQAAGDKIDSWAYRWLFSCWAHSGHTCIPTTNLVSNVGFGVEGTHTTQSSHRLGFLPTGQLPLPIRHPVMMVRNVAADHEKDRFVYSIRKRSTLGKIRKQMSRKLREIIRSTFPLTAKQPRK
jgi:hypothetical protein